MNISEFFNKIADDRLFLIAQIVGIIAVVFTFLSYQARTQKKLITVQSIATAAFALHYLMLGTLAGAVSNIICIFRNIAYCNKDKRIFSGKYVPYVFAALVATFGALAWQGPESLFIIVGIMINTVAMATDNPQHFRMSILLTSTMVLTYNILVISLGGILNECIAIISSVIGLIRYRSRRGVPKMSGGDSGAERTEDAAKTDNPH